MSRSVLCPLVLALALHNYLVLAQEQDAIATVKPSSSKGSTESASALLHSVDQLLRVASQLERDGHAEEAARVRSEARDLVLKENVLARKEAELECLQDEVDRLRKLTGESSTVMVKLIAMEVVRSRLGDRAAEFDKLLGNEEPKGDTGDHNEVGPAMWRPLTLPAASVIRTDSALFEELKSRKAIRFLAEPTLITTNGLPGSYFSGGTIEIPVPALQGEGKATVRSQKIGTEFEFVPTVRTGGRIRLRLKFQQSERDEMNPITVAGTTVPSITTRGVNTEIEIQSGHTVRICGLASSRKIVRAKDGLAGGLGDLAKIVRIVGTSQPSTLDTENALAAADGDFESTEFIVLVTPELVDLPNVQALEPVPVEEEIEVLRKALVPNKLAEDIQYFPATPIPRKGTLK